MVKLSENVKAGEIEDPFGEDINDLPVDDICSTIKKNIADILDCTNSAMKS